MRPMVETQTLRGILIDGGVDLEALNDVIAESNGLGVLCLRSTISRASPNRQGI